MKTPEFKKMIGIRRKNADGFTYGYGVANEYNTTGRHNETKKRCIRADKRSVKQKENLRLKIENQNYLDN
ncbi:MAG: hypothetical protein ABIP51_18090 [Bacteroidia bacterium]